MCSPTNCLCTVLLYGFQVSSFLATKATVTIPRSYSHNFVCHIIMRWHDDKGGPGHLALNLDSWQLQSVESRKQTCVAFFLQYIYFYVVWSTWPGTKYRQDVYKHTDQPPSPIIHTRVASLAMSPPGAGVCGRVERLTWLADSTPHLFPLSFFRLSVLEWISCYKNASLILATLHCPCSFLSPPGVILLPVGICVTVFNCIGIIGSVTTDRMEFFVLETEYINFRWAPSMPRWWNQNLATFFKNMLIFLRTPQLGKRYEWMLIFKIINFCLLIHEKQCMVHKTMWTVMMSVSYAALSKFDADVIYLCWSWVATYLNAYCLARANRSELASDRCKSLALR